MNFLPACELVDCVHGNGLVKLREARHGFRVSKSLLVYTLQSSVRNQQDITSFTMDENQRELCPHGTLI